MAKLPRTTQKIFGKNAPENQITTFGSIKAGTPVYTQLASQIMNSAFEGGWSEAVEDDYAPYRQDRNAVDTALTQQLAYLFQDGIPEWDAGTTYYKGSVVKVVNGNALTFYKSIADNNTASVNTTASWHKMLEINASNQIVSPSINTPTISGGSMSNGTFANPTFSGNVNVPLASQSSSTDSTIAASIGWVNNPSLSSNVVHKTGNEEINGQKTFLQNMIIRKDTESIFYIDNLSADVLAERTDTDWIGSIKFRGKNYQEVFNIRGSLLSNGTQFLYNVRDYSEGTKHLQAVFSSTISKSGVAELRYNVSTNGSGDTRTVFNSALSKITSLTTDTNIPTMGWVNNPATSTNVVHRTGNENISGSKTFTGNITTTATNSFSQIATSLTKGTAPSQDVNAILAGYDKNGISTWANTYARLLLSYLSSNTTAALLQAFKPEASSQDRASLGIYYPATGDPYTEAPTPTASDNSTKIATTEWVNSRITSVMDSNKYITRQITYNNDNPENDYTLPNDAFTEVWCQRAATGMGTLHVKWALPNNVILQRTISSDNYGYSFYFMGYLPKGTVMYFQATNLSRWGYHIYKAGN